MATVLTGGEDVSESSLRRVLANTIATIEDNKGQIFDIYEATRISLQETEEQLAEVENKARVSIERVESLSLEEQARKQHLATVSSHFAENSEDEIRKSYEAVANVQVDLALEKDNEKRLREQRDRLLIRQNGLKGMLKQAEHLAFAVGSVLSYLSSEIGGVVWQIEQSQKEKFVGARIIKAQEEERYRISREIHDGPAQEMANLIFQTSVCEKLVDYDPDEAKRGIQELRQQIKSTLSSLRQVVFDMRPMSLDDLGLAAALKELCRKMTEKNLLEANFGMDGAGWELPKSAEIALFRIVQEALNNAARHSGTKKARLRLLYTNEALSILVEDEGNGFDETEIAKSDEELRLGLLSMKERGRIIGAQVTVSSVKGKGTKVHVRMKKPNGFNEG